MKLFTFIMATTLINLTVQAQTTTTSIPTSPATQVTTTLTAPAKPAPTNIILGYKAATDSGRAADMDVIGGRNARSKNEAFAGYRMDNGWGGFFNTVQSYNSFYKNDAKTKWSQGDSSITLLHPDFYKSPNLSLYGQFRYYIQTTDRSIDKNIHLFAYYFRLNAKFEGGHDIYNEFIPRYFGSTKYDAADTVNYIEDTTIYSYKIDGTGWKIGAKSWAQYEEHQKTGTGYCLEAGPQATYNFNSNFMISPSLSFPLLQNNKVFDGPKAVGTDQAYLSLFLQAKL